MVLYLVSNNYVLNNLVYKNNEALDEKREKRPLSIEGEEEAKRLCDLIEDEISAIYTSSFASAIATSKFVADKLELSINIENKLNDRKIGSLKDKTLRFFKETQEHDFDYKLNNGESINDTKARITNIINKIIKETEDKPTLIITHSTAIMGYLLNWCEKGYNLDDRLILNFNDNVIMDGTANGLDIFKVELENAKVLDIKRI